MKKSGFLSLFLLLITAGTGLAQSQIGLRAGVNVASINDGIEKVENIEEEPWVPRLTLGVATSLHVTDYFALAPEFNYSQRGYEAQGSTLLAGDFTYRYHYDFFEVPVLARLSFGKVLKAYLNMGPTFSYLMSGKEILEQEGAPEEERELEPESNSYNRFEIGGAVGGGLQLDTGIGSFLLDLRYNTAFTDIQEDNFSPIYTLGQAPDTYRTRYVSASLIVLVPSIRD